MTDETPTVEDSASSNDSINKPLLAGVFALGVFVGAGLMFALGESETPDDPVAAATSTSTEAPGTTTTISTTTTTIPSTTTTQPTTTATVGEVGTRANPVPLGTTQRIGPDWEVSVVEVVFDAGEIVANENQFNDPPPDGNQFVMVALALTYLGAESATPWVELSWQYLGPSNVASDEDCGVIPDEMFGVPEMFSGGAAVGKVCHVVVSGDVGPDLLLIIEESFSLDETRAFFALTE